MDEFKRFNSDPKKIRAKIQAEKFSKEKGQAPKAPKANVSLDALLGKKASDDFAREAKYSPNPNFSLPKGEKPKAPNDENKQKKALKAEAEVEFGDGQRSSTGQSYEQALPQRGSGSSQNEYDTSIRKKQALSLRYQIPKKLKDLSNDKLKKLSVYISEQIEKSRQERTDYMDRLFLYRESWNNFESAGLNLTIDGQHDEHIPIVFQQGKDMHARLFQAVMGIEPPFSLIPRKAIAEKEKQAKEDLMRWVLTDYANYGEGIAGEVDKDCWNFIFDGTAITKHSWERDVRKYVDVKVEEVRPLQLDPETGQIVTKETEEETEKVAYDGPMMKTVKLEDLFIVGSNVETVDSADLVAERQYYSKSDIIKAARLGFFQGSAVDRICQTQPDANTILSGIDTDLKQQSTRVAGLSTDQSGIPVYQIYETYLRFDIDDDGIDEELVVWMEMNTRTIARITYLDRVSPSGKRPFAIKKLIPRDRSPYGLGFAEMLYGISNTIDYIANQRLDAGTFQIFPWFVFRAGSGMQAGEIKIAPGRGIPVDDVNDLRFPQVNGNPAYGFQEEASVMRQAEKTTGVSSLDPNGSQGITRTATGAAALVQDINTNLDIYIKRYQRGFKRNLKIIDKQVQELLPLGLEFRVAGVEAKGAAFKRFEDRESIKWDCDYELLGNSINSNKAIQRDTATMLLQTLMNPLSLQSGIVTPQNMYNANKNLLQAYEVHDINAYITNPEGDGQSPYTAQDELNMILAGVKPPIQMMDKHDEKLALFQEFEASDEFGILTQDHLPLYLETKQGHERYAQAIAAQQAQGAMAMSQGANPALSAQIAAGSGNPQGGVPNQIQDLAPASSGLNQGQ